MKKNLILLSLLNFFWAVGLANKTKVLTEGQMVSNNNDTGNFASTGGWTLSKENAQMYEAAKYLNAFWFPGNYYDLALYFKNKEGKKFTDIPGQIILDKVYSSATGWQQAKKWLTDKGIVEAPTKQGGGCGV
ncbi:hypothetical protein HY357_03900 [Candidatus Roizmanbacteria bacterium]|nr:hypothetical protein [Candidatus Roizmanbacteria bacterium]